MRQKSRHEMSVMSLLPVIQKIIILLLKKHVSKAICKLNLTLKLAAYISINLYK